VLGKHSISHAITAAATVAVLLMAAGFAAAPASAGEYTVPFCDRSVTGSTASWTHSTTAGWAPFFYNDRWCSPGSGVVYRRFEVWAIPGGASDDWTFDAPAGTYVSQLDMYQDALPRSSGALNAIYSWQQDGGRTLTAAARPGGVLANASYAFPVSGSKVIKLQTSLLCQGPANCPGTDPAGNYGNEDYWHGAVVHLIDPSLPTFSSLTGEGWKAAPIDGRDSIDYSVADTGAGVKETRFYVDGVLQSSQPAACIAERLVPCPATASGSFTLDTTKLSEGQHNLQLRLVDGSQNEESKQLTITVRRGPKAIDAEAGGAPVAITNTTVSGSTPAVGDRLHGSRGTWSGSGISFAYQWMRCAGDGTGCTPIPSATGPDYAAAPDDLGHALQLCVSASNSGGSAMSCSAPTSAVVAARQSSSNSAPIETAGRATEPAKTPDGTSADSDRGHANGLPAADRVVLTALVNNRSSTIKVKFGKRVPISGRLVAANGTPIANAILNVQTRTAVPDASVSEAAKVVTRSDGRFTYVAPPGPSRVIRFAYRSYSEDTSFADTTDVQLLVRAGVTIKATPRLVHNRHATIFTGRLLGKPISKQGVVVDLQVFFRNKWRTFGAPRTNPAGRYRFKYRFMAGAATWRFRARVRRESSYPYLEGYSRKPMKVKVLG
jgi:hypothetical protein